MATEYDLVAGPVRGKALARIRDYTLAAVEQWAGRLWDTLAAAGFLYVAGKRQGHIRDDCEFLHFPCQKLGFAPLGLARVFTAAETPGIKALPCLGKGYPARDDPVGSVRSGSEKNLVLSVMLATNLCGHLLKPFLLLPGKTGDGGTIKMLQESVKHKDNFVMTTTPRPT